MGTLKIMFVVSLAMFAVACASKKKPEIVPLTPAQQAIKDSPEEKRITELAAVLAEAKAEEKDRKAVRKLDTPEERKARELLASAESRSRKEREKAARTIERARITGCDPANMWIHEDAVEHSTINSFVKVRITNTEKKAYVDIADVKFGPVVKGLCPGASITLFRNRSLHSPDYVQFSYTATGLVDGNLAIAQSETFNLSKYDWQSGGGQQERNWFIRLRER